MSKEKKVTIKDVAKHAGAALGTVDRVLNNTGFVSDKKRDVVMKAIKDLNYVPNKVASALSKQLKINIGVVYPDVEKYFWEQINSGIKKAEKQFEAYGLRIIRGRLSNYDIEEQKKVINDLIKMHNLDGIALVPVHSSKLNPFLSGLTVSGIPFVTFDSDAPKSGRLCFAGEDNIAGGQIAGKLLALFMGGKGRIAVLQAQRDLLAIQQRMSGFLEKITTEYPDIKIAEFHDMYDSTGKYESSLPEIIKKITSDRKAPINGVFVSNGLVGIVGKKIKESGINNKMPIVGFDFSEEINKLIRDDSISATICSDLESEGFNAIKSLYEFIVEGKSPESENIITKYEIKIKETL